MVDFRELLACPACADPLAADWVCRGCGARYDAQDGIPNLRLPDDGRTDAVRRFYERAPFPGYPLRDSLQAALAEGSEERADLASKVALVLGAGGAAKAIAFGLQRPFEQ